MKVYVVTAIDHFKAPQLVCKVFASRVKARKCQDEMLLATYNHGNHVLIDRYSRVELFERTVDCPEMVTY